MSKLGKRLIASAEEAVAFAGGDCEHDWIDAGTRRSGAAIMETKECRKCGIRITKRAAD
jgi:hypothetical protein